MLVIRRRVGESLRIGENVDIELLDIEGGQAKLGIRAPQEIKVWRHEILETIQANRRAAQSGVAKWLERRSGEA